MTTYRGELRYEHMTKTVEVNNTKLFKFSIKTDETIDTLSLVDYFSNRELVHKMNEITTKHNKNYESILVMFDNVIYNELLKYTEEVNQEIKKHRK